MAKRKRGTYIGGHTVAGRQWFSNDHRSADRQEKQAREGAEAHQRFLDAQAEKERQAREQVARDNERRDDSHGKVFRTKPTTHRDRPSKKEPCDDCS